MESKEYSIEQSIIELLELLGYEYLNSKQITNLQTTKYSLRDRNSFLMQPLEQALLKLNPWMTKQNLIDAVYSITNVNAHSLIEANKQCYSIMTNGISIQDRAGVSQTIRFIDFVNPELNQYICTSEFRIRKQDSRDYVRLDLVIFVNGIPLAVLELKSGYNALAIECGISQLVSYQKRYYQLFHTVQILTVTCGIQAVFGTIGNHNFSSFIKPYPMTIAALRRLINKEPSAQDILIYSLFTKENLLEYVKNFIAHFQENHHSKKLIARYYERIAVDKAIQRIQNQTSPRDRGGVIWYAPGVSKNFTIACLIQKLRHNHLNLNKPTILIVTDRKDSATQLADMLQKLGITNFWHPTGIKNLQKLLNQSQGETILTTIQKLYQASQGQEYSNLSSDTFIILDDAHRNQYGSMATKMRKAFENAVFIAFTSTPIDKKDRSTVRAFGDYIYKYTVENSVNDRTTLPVFLESRCLNEFKQSSINSNKYRVIKTVAEIKMIASDIKNHFENVIKINGFKGQIITSDVQTAKQLKEELDILKAPESAVISTHIAPQQRHSLIQQFLNPKDSLSLILTTSSFIPSYHIPIEQVIYLCVPLTGHALLHAMGCVNHPYKDKDSGLIVDYCDVSDNPSNFLEIFNQYDLDKPIQDQKQEILILQKHHFTAIQIFEGCDLNDYEAALEIIRADFIRQKFDRAYRAFAKSLNFLYPDFNTLQYEADLKWLSKIRILARHKFDESSLNWDDIPPKIKQLIDVNLTSDLNKIADIGAKNDSNYYEIFKKHNYRQHELKDSVAIELAKSCEKIIKELAVFDWKRKADIKREMRKKLKRLLLSKQIPRSEIDSIIGKLIERAKDLH